jgi:hypothetical protein
MKTRHLLIALGLAPAVGGAIAQTASPPDVCR